MKTEDAVSLSAPGSAEPRMVSASSQIPEWDGYLRAHPAAGLCHDARWGQAMREAYGNVPFYLTARRGERVCGVLQLVLQKSLLFGTHLCSTPYLDAAGILADDADSAAALVQQAGRLREEHRARWVELRQLDPIALPLPSRTDKVTLRLPLPADPEVLWKGLKAKVRNQVRKAQSATLTASHGGAELLREFHAIYVRNMRDLGSPPHSLRFFQRLADLFGPSVRLFVVRRGEGPLAASFTLADGHGLHVPWAGSDWRASDSCPNMLLYWSMLEEACRMGAPQFDFGRSTRDSGTYRFKTQWGAEEVPLHWQYVLPAGEDLPELRMDNPKFRMMVACWRRLPLWAARRLGPPLVSRLS